MKCPHCQSDLLMTERQGIEIDYCPNCRGVWLDRGELDKIIERSTTLQGSSSPPPQRSEKHRDRDHDEGHRPHKKKESFWSELFDFG